MPTVDLTPYQQPQNSTSDGSKFDNLIAAIQTAFNGGIDDANIAPAAGIAASKLSAYPADVTKFLAGDGTWQSVTVTPVVFRKSTAKVVSTTADTDLLNGEFTLGANVLGLNKTLRLTVWGDNVFTSGAAQASPRFKLKVGAGPTVLLDTGAVAAVIGSGVTRGDWRFLIEVTNLGAANAQEVQCSGRLFKFGADAGFGSAGQGNFATGAGAVDVARTANVFTRVEYDGRNVGAIDTTGANLVQFTVVNGSSTSTDTTLKGAVAEVV